MKAAVLNAFGAPLAIETLPDPAPGPGQVVVDVVAAGVTSYAGAVFDGSRNYALELPVAPGPGGIGRVRSTGPDATHLKAGDWVYCDATIRARDNTADQILLGWTYRTEAALPLHRVYHHGSFAEQMLVPTENATPIGDIDPAQAARWCGIGRLLVPFGGLLAGSESNGLQIIRLLLASNRREPTGGKPGMIFENAEGVATGNAPVLTGIAAKDHAGITLEGQGKKLSHFLNTHRSGFIENNCNFGSTSRRRRVVASKPSFRSTSAAEAVGAQQSTPLHPASSMPRATSGRAVLFPAPASPRTPVKRSQLWRTNSTALR